MKVERRAKIKQARSRREADHSQTTESEIGDLAGRLVTVLEPDSPAAEAYRTMRTNLLYALVDNPPKVILLTSPGLQEGKSTTCANLGVVLAQSGKRSLILDCDLRKPVIHRIFGLPNTQGLVDILSGERSLQEVWQEPLTGLKVVSGGSLPPNPTELLGSGRLAEFLEQVRREFDYILVDAPPVGLVSDAAILATQVDGVLLTLDTQRTRKGDLRRSIRSLETVGAQVIGTVANNFKVSAKDYARLGGYGYWSE